MARDVPFRKSLLTRLLAVSVLVSVGSIAATAWLAAQTTSGAIRQEQGQVLADDARIYDRLLGIGAAAPDWRGADKAVRELARETGRRIALTTQERKVITDSAVPAGGPAAKDARRPAALPPQASAVVDPLSVDTTLAGRPDDRSADRIDPRAVGPYRLPASERTRLKNEADGYVSCLHGLGLPAELVVGPGGRPVVETGEGPGTRPAEILGVQCPGALLERPTRTEQKAVDKLNSLVEACMKRRGLGPVAVSLDLTGRDGARPVGVIPTYPPVEPEAADGSGTEGGVEDGAGAGPGDGPGGAAAVPGETPGGPSGNPSGSAADSPSADSPSGSTPSARPGDPASTPSDAAATPSRAARSAVSGANSAAVTCVDTARREQLGPFVSTPALLFITSSDGAPVARGFSLSVANTARLAGLAAAVLAVTVAVTALAATRLTRPLRALTTATRRMKSGTTEGPPVPASATRSAGEISQLAAAFNDMAAHRKALEEQRRAMVSDVAHELRTPLSNIRGWLEAAEDGVVETDPELVTSLLEEALLLQHIVDDLQDLAAADAGTLRLHREPVRAAEIAEQVAAAHQARADAAGVRLRATTLGDPWLDADPLRLRQAVGNLVSNAIRHTPDGGSVRITCRTTPDAVLVEVADTGTGIEPDDLPHVFDRFWRADKSRTRATGGSGLGLSIVRNLTEAHGGTVTAESTPGKGSLFTVRLPQGRAGAV
ncbi:ATP-binding protein [Streptomyces sp. NPDC087300]|uniref:HAMP domain-containing sensor histidine kinase n=1 Tax=Streptomyces sp. NPDC087300 TaxID=3365780 RepID=UPI00382AF5AC